MDSLETQVPLVHLATKASTDIMDNQARKDLQAMLAGQATTGNPGKLVNAETQAVRARTPSTALAHVKRTEIKLLHKPMIEIYGFFRSLHFPLLWIFYFPSLCLILRFPCSSFVKKINFWQLNIAFLIIEFLHLITFLVTFYHCILLHPSYQVASD